MNTTQFTTIAAAVKNSGSAFNVIIRAAAERAISTEENWSDETTVFTFKDGSRLLASYPEVIILKTPLTNWKIFDAAHYSMNCTERASREEAMKEVEDMREQFGSSFTLCRIDEDRRTITVRTPVRL